MRVHVYVYIHVYKISPTSYNNSNNNSEHLLSTYMTDPVLGVVHAFTHDTQKNHRKSRHYYLLCTDEVTESEAKRLRNLALVT